MVSCKIKLTGQSIPAYALCNLSCRCKTFLITICSILFLSASANVSAQEIIVDNKDSNISQTGTWATSGAPGFWADDSVWSRTAGSSFSFNANLVPGATYAVYEWHTAWPSRYTSVPHQVRDGSTLLGTVNVNQAQNTSQWHLLGTYVFTSGSASVTIQVASGAIGDQWSTNADAVRFVPVNLQSIEITGPSTVNENSVTNYDAIAYFSDGSSQNIEPQVWNVNVAQASINSSGVLAALSVDADTPAVISAQYTAGSITVNDTHDITIHNSGAVLTDIIVDNLDSTTSSVGTWGASGAPDFWATDSVWSRTAGNSFIFSADLIPGATYQVYEWHTEWPSRYTAVPHQIRDGSTVLDTVNVNQTINGGQWRLLGTYVFTSGSASVTIQVAPGATGNEWSTNADAVKFTYLEANTHPTAIIDSITPNPSNVNSPVTFTGHGTDSDGTITAYSWESSIDGVLSNANSFSTSSLSLGTHTISFKVMNDSSEWSAPVTETLRINNVLPADIIVDNLDTNTSSVSTWEASGAPGYWASNSVWSRTAGASFKFNAALIPGATYEVYEWHTEWSSRYTAVPHQIRDNTTLLATINVNQKQNTSQWHLLGTYTFTSGSASVTIQVAPGATGNEWSTNADAVKFVFTGYSDEPTAVIDSISPNPALLGQTILFKGHGIDSDGTIKAYNWESNIDGTIGNTSSFTSSSLSEGTHTITLRVQDNEDKWSNPVSKTLVYVAPFEVAIDNRDPATTRDGLWLASGATGFYGTDSEWSKDNATFTWNFTPPVSGYYELYMWWTEWPSRSTEIPVIVESDKGTSRLYINQQSNGGKWNFMRLYTFQAGTTYKITIVSQPGPSSTCADAVRFNFIGSGNLTPVALIDSISPNPVLTGQSVSFKGHGEDGDGSITAYSWMSNIAGTISNSATFSTSGLTSGTHIIQFRVLDNKNQWSDPVTAYLDIGLEHIYIAPVYFGKSLPKWRFEQLLINMGATQQSAKQWTYVDTSINKTYIIHFVSSAAELTQAMYRDGAHILVYGHSNYGLGGIFATNSEANNEMITDIRYVDDDRIINYNSPMVGVSISGMRTGQAYPFWWPNNKIGTSAIMPYDFGDPNGNPPYNYYLTYKVPGDPTLYRVQTVNNSALQRFPGYGVPAWYSPDGRAPNPNITSERSYFIRNTAAWKPSFITTGTWQQFQDLPAVRDNSQYYKENYITNSAGTGNDTAKWIFDIPKSANYIVSAWWPALSTNASNAPFTVKHSGGTTTVPMNQTINGHRWNTIGQFNFGINEYNVLLTDNVSSGNVVADGIRISHINNPPVVVQADFRATPLSGYAPLKVAFYNTSTGDLTERTWNLGDGFINTTRDELEHQYTTPGIYSVTLTVRGPDGTSTRTKTDYIHVWPAGSQQNEPLKAEFSSNTKYGQIPFSVRFTDRSTGNINSWLWNFGDGQTSSEQHPSHTYTNYGNYTVTLTVRDNSGAQATETKTNFVRAVIFEKSIDNVDYPKTHSGSKVIVKVKAFDVLKERFRYNRMLYDSCDSGAYYINTFGHGLLFYTVNLSGADGSLQYLRSYLEGKSNHEIWEDIQQVEAVYDYYNFNLRPDQQQTAAVQSLDLNTAATPLTASLPKEKDKAKIKDLTKKTVQEAIDILEDPNYLANPQLMKETIEEAFKNRKKEAVEIALSKIKKPVMQAAQVSTERRLEFIVAKSILQAFPDESIKSLLELYENSDIITKENVINIIGKQVNYPEVSSILKNALNDTTMCINNNPEIVGEPLRICDLAYNQLVLNLKIKDVLRVIGSGMDMETRDYHIDILKGKI